MDRASVQELFRRAVADSDAAVMRQGLEQMLGLSEGRGLSAEEEYVLRREDFLMDMPQSGERIRGRDAMRAMQEAFPTPPQGVTIRRVFGARHVWVLEGELDYGQGPWRVCLVMELDEQGLIAHETRYYAQRSEAPAWRAAWVEPLPDLDP
jgi:hypothetical protein